MIDEILSTSAGGKARIALREEGRVVDLVVSGDADGGGDTAGTIVLGRVTTVIKGMEAAFVDIGTDRAGFLSLVAPRVEDAPAAEGEGEDIEADTGLPPLHEGQEVLVQVAKSPQGGKGAGLNRTVSLPGRYLVLTPVQPRIAISRRIQEPGLRQSLAALMEEIRRPGEGFILRTAARDADAEALAEDAEALRRQWAEIEDRLKGATPPCVLYAPRPGLAEVLRDQALDGLRRIVVDDARAEAVARSFVETHLTGSATRIEHWQESEPLFEALGIEDAIAEALEPQVSLPCGGSLIIEQTHALTAVDVNTGRNLGRTGHADTVRVTNIEAAREIPRQLRLRGLGGITVIDFIHMEEEADREQVVDELMRGLARDPFFIRATGMSELGLVELTRRRGAGTLRERLEGADD